MTCTRKKCGHPEKRHTRPRYWLKSEGIWIEGGRRCEVCYCRSYTSKPRRDGRAWWASLTDRQRREHGARSALGCLSAVLGACESSFRRWGPGGPVLGRLFPEIERNLAWMEDVAHRDGYSLKYIARLRGERERAAQLRVAMNHWQPPAVQ